MTTKRSTTAKKVNASRSNAAKLVRARKKAKARMDQWVDEEQFVSLATAGVQFVGTLSRLGDDPNGYGDFLFKSAFGVSSLLFLLIFDQFSFEEMAHELTKLGLKVWYDRFSLRVGDSLHDSIELGLSNSRYGVVVFSPTFFGKNWTRPELNGLFAREMDGHKVILPIWHQLSRADVLRYEIAANSMFFLQKLTQADFCSNPHGIALSA